ncbi:MAG: hypothetical protein H2184_15835 [Candidatus Galacturonibacter soehngenii]|nr:hypothetical protein [Candidatus Galacturonibacter soehngenii]
MYESVKVLYTFIIWGGALVSGLAGGSCIKDCVEAKMYGTPFSQVITKITKKIIAFIVAAIATVYVSTVVGYL